MTPPPTPNIARRRRPQPAPARAPHLQRVATRGPSATSRAPAGWTRPGRATIAAGDRTARGEQGFFTIWVLGLCACLFVVGGISLDVWRGFSERRALANLTDGAATAAASQIDLTAFRAKPSVVKLDHDKARRRATAYLETESTKSHMTLRDVEITVNDTRVVVKASTDLDLSLTRILQPTSKPVGVTTTSAADPKEA